ncbi:hypothetical protein MBLNU13_g11630t1 [Cladosporium sp. NU13]
MPPSRQTNPWTFEQRLCLDVLWTAPFTNLSNKDRAKAHNAIFNDEFSAFGASHGRTTTAISAQYSERMYTHKPSWKVTWEQVCAVPKRDLELREDFQRKINDVLQLGEGGQVDGQGDATPPPPPPPETPRRTERARKVTQNSYDFYMDLDPVTPVQQQQMSSQTHATSNPYATPGPSTRKRPAAAAHSFLIEDDDDDDDELLYEDAEYVPKAKKARRPSPQVYLSPPPEGIVAQVPRTPNKSPKRREGAIMLFTQPSGRELMLKPKEYEQASRPLQDVTEEAAHPHPPAMLFRYWHSKSHGINSDEGFVSGKFVPKNILVEPRGPPDCATIDMNEFAHHLNNRTGTDQGGIPSPFISTANNLAWSVRMALKRMDLGANLSVIDPSKLDSKAIYYVPPFFEALKMKRCFERGYFGYRGTHEHMIYHKIPTSAMVKTFTVNELIAFAKSDRDVKRVLRLDLMSVAKTPSAEIIKALKHDNLSVNSRVARAIGKIVNFLGLDHKSSREMLSRAVFEVVQGWALKADGVSQEKADCFIKQFQDKTDDYINIRDQVKLKQAFLHGLQWSCGDLNVHLKGPAEVEKMEDRAVKRGLTNPSTLLINELNELETEVASFEAEQRESHMGQRGRLALPQGRHQAQLDEGEVGNRSCYA